MTSSYSLGFGRNENQSSYNIIEGYGIAVGDYRAVTNMKKNGVKLAAIVNLYAEWLEVSPFEDEVEYKICDEEEEGETSKIPRLNIDIEDCDDEDDEKTHIGKYFPRIVAFVEKNQPHPHQLVLFQCAAGVSRSVAAACAYLMKSFRLDFDGALNLIRNVRNVGPNPWFQTQLLRWDNELTKMSIERKRKRCRVVDSDE